MHVWYWPTTLPPPPLYSYVSPVASRVRRFRLKFFSVLGEMVFAYIFPEQKRKWAANPSALQQKSHLCIYRKGIARPQSQFPHSYVCEQKIGNNKNIWGNSEHIENFFLFSFNSQKFSFSQQIRTIVHAYRGISWLSIVVVSKARVRASILTCGPGKLQHASLPSSWRWWEWVPLHVQNISVNLCKFCSQKFSKKQYTF